MKKNTRPIITVTDLVDLHFGSTHLTVAQLPQFAELAYWGAFKAAKYDLALVGSQRKPQLKPLPPSGEVNPLV